MSGLYDGYTEIKTEGKAVYFAGANTGRGFVSSYPALADENRLKRVYILKGGPGTGKSTMLARIADKADCTIEYDRCGSDPDSLDCVVLGGSVAVLDGTSPHIRDMQTPGAASTLVDLSRFWNEKELTKARDRITALAVEKSLAYASAYRWLAAAETLESERTAAIVQLFRYEKADAWCTRFLRKLPKPTVHTVTERYTHAISMKGRVCVNTLAESADVVYTVRDAYGCAEPFLDLLASRLKTDGYAVLIGRHPIGERITGILLPEQGIAVTVGRSEGARALNMTRFVTEKIPIGLRGELRLATRCMNECLASADHCLKSAAHAHFELEKIYSSAMDFAALREMCDLLCREVCGLV